LPRDVKTIWILSHARAGDLDQMLALARALDWPATVKRLAFRTPKLAAIPFLARQLFDPSRSDSLEPPWPDLIVCAEGRASAIARLIKSRSHGIVKTVCLGRPAGTPANFDLVLTTPQFRLAAASNIVELALPLAPEVRASGDDPPEYPRPVTAVLLGGTSLPERLDRQAAAALAREVVAQAHGGTCVFITSPRTDPAAAAALAEAVASPPHIVHLWQRGGDNPYWRVLTAADRAVVTSDSISMVMDALAAGKPVSVYRLPQHHTVRNRVVDWLHGRTSATWLFDRGIIEVRADRNLLFDKLAAQGHLAWFSQFPPVASAAPALLNETAKAVAKVRQLFAGADAC
jgi:uncharacterized protein